MALTSTLAFLLATAIVLRLTLFRRRSAVEQVPGPPSSSWLYGNLLDISVCNSWGEHEFEWQRRYGAVYRVKGCFGTNRLMVSDPQALQHILTSSTFSRTPNVQHAATALFGQDSVISVKGVPLSDMTLYLILKNFRVMAGDDHRRARAVMNPAFSSGAMRRLVPLFERTAAMLTSELEESLLSTSQVDMSPALVRATMSAISQAVFGCSLQDLGADLVENHSDLYATFGPRTRANVLLDTLMHYIPLSPEMFNLILPPNVSSALGTSHRLTHELGTRMLKERVRAREKGLEVGSEDGDLFGTFLNSEMSEKGKYFLEKDEIVAQTAVLLLAGQDTTSNSLAFGLRELAKHPQFQKELREEIHSSPLGGGGGSGAAYDSLPLLNAFIKETLRLWPAEPLAESMAVEDTFLPLKFPITLTTGEQITKLPVKKGQLATIAIGSYQRSEAIWGADAQEFRPRRWLDDGELNKAGELPHIGPYANLLTFFAGPRTCLGWRFAVVEMQVLLSELVSKFSFSLPEDDEILPRHAVTLMPLMPSGKKGSPMRVSRVL
ncbi:cytochrome P450 [Roridomyces roridus]|uniref:Cytochrome P450 n=1 Tax=Roridomyces roridus TaxID=1738132 RepID=A0AAD7B4U7_9AGAR|nr:cytochrome P450 [Roridomyces roridus]